MEPTPFVEFEVGGIYTNEKGDFEVISIDGDRMVIKWESGEEFESTVSFQRRIQKRRYMAEVLLQKKAASAARKSRAGRKPAAPFEGLKEDVFQNRISRIPWRTRQHLGGAVARLLDSTRFRINSWAASGRNEVYWADATHWKEKTVTYPAKFFAKADESSLVYGFYIERPDTSADPSPDWNHFARWLKKEENNQWLLECAREHELSVFDGRQSSFSGIISPGKTTWKPEGGKAVKTISDLVDKWPETNWLDFMIGKRLTKTEALARGSEISSDIAQLIGELLPVYEAAVTR